MNVNEPTTIQYVPQGFEVLKEPNVETINNRYLTRYDTEIPLAPSFDPRPVQTKYTLFGCIDQRFPVQEPIQMDPIVDWKNQNTKKGKQPFTQPTQNGPPLAYYMNLDKETAIQRQGYYLFNNQNEVHTPSQNSDLYLVQQASYSGYGGSGEKNPTENSPYLFDQYQYTTKQNARFANVATQYSFNNPTQARNIQPLVPR
jgi:hypothetical protein